VPYQVEAIPSGDNLGLVTTGGVRTALPLCTLGRRPILLALAFSSHRWPQWTINKLRRIRGQAYQKELKPRPAPSFFFRILSHSHPHASHAAQRAFLSTHSLTPHVLPSTHAINLNPILIVSSSFLPFPLFVTPPPPPSPLTHIS
jgi:hypothetical protein